jgi:hypothetical protein
MLVTMSERKRLLIDCICDEKVNIIPEIWKDATNSGTPDGFDGSGLMQGCSFVSTGGETESRGHAIYFSGTGAELKFTGSASSGTISGTAAAQKFTGTAATGTISGTAAAQTFTGTDTYLKTAVEVGTAASFTGASMTSTGSVDVPKTYSASTTTNATESKTVTVT